jgi:hypothetical protein
MKAALEFLSRDDPSQRIQAFPVGTYGIPPPVSRLLARF